MSASGSPARDDDRDDRRSRQRSSSPARGESNRDGPEHQPMWSLALSNLDPTISEEELKEFFRTQPGGADIFSAQVFREASGERSTGFVHYLSNASYAAALDECAEIEIKGRLAKAFPADDKRKLYVRNLPRGMTERDLREEFERLTGKPDSVNLGSKGDFCFVTYVNFLQAERALKIINGASLHGNQLRAEPAKQRDTRGEASGGGAGNTSLHVRNLSRATTKESLTAHFEPCGRLREVRIPAPRPGDEANSAFGFVEFEEAEDAAKAITRMAHTQLDGSTIEVCFSKSKAQGQGRRDGGGYGRDNDRYDDRRGRGYGGRDDDRGRYDDRSGGYGGRGMMPPGYPPFMGAYPGFNPAMMAAMMAAGGGGGGRGGAGAPPMPYGAAAAAYAPYMAPYMAAMGAMGAPRGGMGGAPSSSSSRDSSASTTAFPPAASAYGAAPSSAAYSSMYADPRYAAMYAQQMMAAQAQQAAQSGSRSSKDSSSKRRSSRSRSPKRRSERSSSPSRSRSRSRDRKRR